MKRLSVLLAIASLLLNLSAFVPAQAGVLAMKGKVLVGACSQDGSANAPTGTKLYASRRATWAFPPTCLSPDVDYPTGADCVNIVCVSPATLTSYYDPALHRIRCDGSNGLTFQNIDFSLVGGGGFDLTTCNNVTIRNVNITFYCAQGTPILQAADSSGVVVDRVSIDGGSRLSSQSCEGAADEMISLGGTGAKSVTYTRVVNSNQHDITFNCPAPATCTAIDRFNSFSRTGFEQGSHGNSLQFGGLFSSINVDHNYYYNPQPDTALLAPLAAAFTLNSATVDVTVGAQGSFLAGMSITGTRMTGTQTIVSSVDLGGGVTRLTISGVATSTGSGTINVPNAYPIGDTISIRYQAATGGGGNPTGLSNGTIIGNVFDGDGPIQGRVYAINAAVDPSNICDTLAINGNYVNLAGISGGFFTNSGCTNVTGSGNKNLATGAPITVP